MYFTKIELSPKKTSASYDEVKDLIWYFLCSLERNGQILKDYKLIQCENYILYVTLPKQDSFDEKYDGIYVKQHRQKINELYECILTPLGKNMESSPYCECRQRTAMEMQTFTLDIDSVFICCDCGKPIVYYELPFPAEREEDHYLTCCWQENYASMDKIWMNCLCDRYTGNQRVKLDSALNKQGIKIAEYMSKQLGYPVYYHLACDYGKSIKAEQVGDQQIHFCPKCGKLMKRVRFSENYEIDICEDCMLSYAAH